MCQFIPIRVRQSSHYHKSHHATHPQSEQLCATPHFTRDHMVQLFTYGSLSQENQTIQTLTYLERTFRLCQWKLLF